MSWMSLLPKSSLHFKGVSPQMVYLKIWPDFRYKQLFQARHGLIYTAFTCRTQVLNLICTCVPLLVDDTRCDSEVV